MALLNTRRLKTQANIQLGRSSCDYKRLVLIHTGIALGANILVSLLQLYLNQQISAAGGLSGLGTRTILETIQTVLNYAVSIALPFWEMGFVFAALRLARGEQTGFQDLPEGFRRFGPVLRLYLLEGAVFMGAGFISMYAGGFLYAITPFSTPMQEMLLSFAEKGDLDGAYAALEAMSPDALLKMFLPALVIMGVLFLVLALVLHYRFRMAQFIVMDRPGTGALMALTGSSRMTRHHRMELFRLDLSFWWFYALAALSGLVMYSDSLLGYMGVELPLSADALWIISYILGCLIQLAVYWRSYAYVQTTFAVAYDELRMQPPEEPKAQHASQKLPWNNDYQKPE